MPGTGRRGKMPLFEPSDIIGESIDVEPSGGTIAEPLEKVFHIPAIGGDTILRKLPLAGNITQKTFEPSQPVCLGFDGSDPKFPPPGIELHGYVIGNITGNECPKKGKTKSETPLGRVTTEQPIVARCSSRRVILSRFVV